MSIQELPLWKTMTDKAEKKDDGLPSWQKIHFQYIAAVETVCQLGLDRSELIRDTFPLYTLHNHVHIEHVIRIMGDLLGNQIDRLTRDEAALLLMAACCHDIGMSCSNEEKKELMSDTARLNRYLRKHPSAYAKAYAHGDTPHLTEEMWRNYLRSIHHERVEELLTKEKAVAVWPKVLQGKVDRQAVIRVCKSHGELLTIQEQNITTSGGIMPDERFCAVLLCLADIMDFDASRAPQAVYRYSGFDQAEDSAARISRDEWKKHFASNGFIFPDAESNDRANRYELLYSATCSSMQVEQTINSYLDWVDQELDECATQLADYAGKWQDFVLPLKVNRHKIEKEGYVSGQFCLTMDQDQILKLLSGNNLYTDPAAFVRELIQNAIDAARTREQLDKNLPVGWKGQISIRSWMDEEGYSWLRVEDNGTGMTQEIIENYFLKVGRSYYNSNEFEMERTRCRTDPDYRPISRFGIGILSCFMGNDDGIQVEVSTRRFAADGVEPPALRLSMDGLHGYYYLASSDVVSCQPGEMRGVTADEKRPYRSEPGTVVAVRTNLMQSGLYKGFKEIVDRYVLFPQVAVHYSGPDGDWDYPTQTSFMDAIHAIHPAEDRAQEGTIELSLTEDQRQELARGIPEVTFDKCPKVVVKCAAFDRYTKSPYLTGAVLMAKVVNNCGLLTLNLEGGTVQVLMIANLIFDRETDTLMVKVNTKFTHATLAKIYELRQQKDYVQNIWEHQERRSDLLRQVYAVVSLPEEMVNDILEAMITGYCFDKRWKGHMKQIYNISDGVLRNDMGKVQAACKKAGLSLLSQDEWDVYHVCSSYKLYDKLFSISCLQDYSWYQTYFKTPRYRTGLDDVVAHNGILCGEGAFFTESTKSGKWETVLLLRDRYRPDIDLSRNTIRALPLEAACDLALIRSELQREGYEVESDWERSAPREHLRLVPASAFDALLRARPDFTERIQFAMKAGTFSLDQLKMQVESGRSFRLQLKQFLFSQYTPNLSLLYKTLQLACLRREFKLQMRSMQLGSDKWQFLLLCPGHPVELGKGEALFPVAMFLPSAQPNAKLTVKENSYRVYNSDHRLSRFLLGNAPTLHQRCPEILREFTRALLDESDNLVETVNRLLTLLRELPGAPVRVPDDLFLTDDDLL